MVSPVFFPPHPHSATQVAEAAVDITL